MKYIAPEMEMKELEVEDILMSGEEENPTEPPKQELPDDDF